MLQRDLVPTDILRHRSDAMVLPNFLVIGANKAGTTSLYHYLKQHPAVYMSPVKEPMFFSLYGMEKPPPRSAPYMEKAVYDPESYCALFGKATTETALGEASTSYLAVPRSAATIQEFVPDVRLIAILRDPADRAFSHYQMDVRMGLEDLSFEQAVEQECTSTEKGEPTRRRYIRYGMYGAQLAEYYSRFKREQIRVYLYDDFKREPLCVVQDIFRFLQVDDTFVPDMTMEHNTATGKKRRAAPVPPHVRYKARIKSLLKRVVASPNKEKPEPSRTPALALAPKTRSHLRHIFHNDILALQELLGRDLKQWLEDA